MIEPITQEEFATAQGDTPHTWPTSLSPEMAAIRALEPSTGVKMTCRWKHGDKTRSCYGGTSAYREARKHGRRVRIRCKDKVLYVWRVA